MDGVYETNINTPMGKINIRLALKQSGNILNGMIEIMGNKYPLSPGMINNNRCYFKGNLQNKQNNNMSLKYELNGEIIENILNIYARTNMGEFNIKANKIL